MLNARDADPVESRSCITGIRDGEPLPAGTAQLGPPAPLANGCRPSLPIRNIQVASGMRPSWVKTKWNMVLSV